MHRSDPSEARAARFRYLWFGQAVSQLGDYVALFAIPFYVFDQITDDPAWFGRIFFAETIPAVIFGLSSGILLDRWRRKRVMIVTDLIRAALFVVLAGLADGRVEGGVWAVAVLSFLLGTAAAGFTSALYAYVPALVSRADLTQANARLRVTQQLFFILGPALSGVIIAGFGFPLAFMVNASTFLISALTLLPLPPDRTSGQPDPAGYRKGTMEGIRFIWEQPLLRYVTIGAFMTNFLNSYVEAVLVLLSDTVFGVSDAQGISYVYAAFGLGGVLGALTAKRATRRFGLGRAFVLGMFVWGLGIEIATFTSEYLVALAVFAVAGFGLPWVVVAHTTTRQVVTPARILGRVTAASSAVVLSALPIGALLLTSIASGAGVVLVARVVPGLLLATGVYLVFTPLWRESDETIDLTALEADELASSAE